MHVSSGEPSVVRCTAPKLSLITVSLILLGIVFFINEFAEKNHYMALLSPILALGQKTAQKR